MTQITQNLYNPTIVIEILNEGLEEKRIDRNTRKVTVWRRISVWKNPRSYLYTFFLFLWNLALAGLWLVQKDRALVNCFLQIINHGVPTSLLEEFRMQIVSFFNLPYEEKKLLWQDPQDHEGFGQLFVVSEEQKLDWSDMFYITTLPLNLRKPHLFQKLPLKLRFLAKFLKL